MKTLSQILKTKDKPSPSSPVEPDSVTSYVPKTKDEKRFMDKHVVKKTEDANGNKDDVFRATNIKTYDRKERGHGYNMPDDQKVYEARTLSQILGEKKLTSAEMKKREEVAKAIERENPGMPMAKKMAIATATAKKVAEGVEQIDELKKSTITSYINKTVDPVYGIPKGGKEKIQKRLAGLTRAHQRIVGHKPMTKEEVEKVEEAQETKAEFVARQERLAAASAKTAQNPERQKRLMKIPGYSAAMDLAKKTTSDMKKEDIDEAQFWGNKELAKQAHAASGSTSIVRGRDAKGVYTATLLRKKGESEHKEVSRVYDTKEDVEQDVFHVFAEDIQPHIRDVFESLNEENQQLMLEMIESEQYDTVVEIVREIVNA